ncbi:retinol dehydrogenase 11-like [Protopterus annectens]|uniref:retinol dehydrogenase 11-like n=1 Tax=Protopterus annectens TaxID=7888 RepID=UPI001CF93E08|nr:retinol dehydrogenase 11-like [Protopterus annectens]
MDYVSVFSHWFVILSALIIIILVLKKALYKTSWKIQDCHVSLAGRTAIVTGANTGLGKHIAMEFASRKARVILACRSRERGQKALEDIRSLTGNGDVHLRIIDTSSMQSVRRFTEQFLKEEQRLDILVNNAGVSGLPKGTTDEGFEITYSTNHLGPFLLTNLLLELMKKTPSARIINVTSVMHKQGKFNLKHLKGEDINCTAQSEFYDNTKLLNVLFTMELARKLQGTNVTVNCAHPGIVMTDVMRNYNIVFRVIFQLLGLFFFKTPKEGAVSILYSAMSEEMEGISGKYIDSDCTLTLPSTLAQDETIQKKLWDASEELTGLKEKKEK